MAHINIQQNNFSSGAIKGNYIQRKDLNLYANGVKHLKNMDILPSGALQRRGGTIMHHHIISGTLNYKLTPRMETFTSYDGRNFILTFEPDELRIFEVTEDEIVDKGFVETKVFPISRKLSGTETKWERRASQSLFWNYDNMHELKIIKGENYFIICHPDHQPVILLYSPKRESPKKGEQVQKINYAPDPDSSNLEIINTKPNEEEASEEAASEDTASEETSSESESSEGTSSEDTASEETASESESSEETSSEEVAEESSEEEPLVPPFEMHHWMTHMTKTGRFRMPYSRFGANKDIKLKLTAAEGSHIDKRNTLRCYLETEENHNFFTKAWVGAWVRIADNGGKELEVLEYLSANKLLCRVEGVTKDRALESVFTTDWYEAIFSKARGWPSCGAFHKGRLILAASRSFGKTIWMSKVGDYHDFALGENSDSAIDITLSAGESRKINYLLSSKHLQIFTDNSEWVISDDIITATQITLQKRTNIGSHDKRDLQPLLVNGSSIFLDRNNNLHEYTYTALEDDYIVNDLSHLLNDSPHEPVKTTYDAKSRRLFKLMSNGGIDVLNLYQAENITAWTQYESGSAEFIDLATINGRIFILIRRTYLYRGQRYASIFLEEFDKLARRDGIFSLPLLDSVGPKYFPAALRYKNGIAVDTKTRQVSVYHSSSLIVEGDSITEAEYEAESQRLEPVQFEIVQRLLERIYRKKRLYSDEQLYAGIPIEIYIESLPLALNGVKAHSRYRLLDAIFHHSREDKFTIDLGIELKHKVNSNLIYSNFVFPLILESKKITGNSWSHQLKDQVWKIYASELNGLTLYGVDMRFSIH